MAAGVLLVPGIKYDLGQMTIASDFSSVGVWTAGAFGVPLYGYILLSKKIAVALFTETSICL